jgi:hypothetical protein
MRNYIIVAPYGYEELDEICENRERYPLVYLRSELSRTPFVKKDERFNLIFCEKSEYDESDKVYFCKDVAERALDGIASARFVYVILPKEIFGLFLEQLALAKDESRGDVATPPFQTQIEIFSIGLSFDADDAFCVRYLKTPQGYLPKLMRYARPDTEAKGIALQLKQKEEEQMKIEGMYTVLLSGDLSGLSFVNDDELKMLEERFVRDDNYSMAAKIRDLRKEKDF